MKGPASKIPNLNFWIAYFVIAPCMVLLVYTVAQQDYRQTADDPQVQLAEDAVAALDRGDDPHDVITNHEVDVAKSLSPFMAVFDDKCTVIASNGVLNGDAPQPPTGSFDYAKTNGQNRFTWEPKPGVREAAVLIYKGDENPRYVLAARSLREVEAREDRLFKTTLAAFAGVLGLGLILLVGSRKR